MAKHRGEKTTRELLGKTFYQPEMKEDVEDYVHMCIKCQSTKLVHKKKFGLYRPFPIPLGPFEIISMDFMTCLLEWEVTNAIFVVVDRFLKLTKFTPTQTNNTVVGTAKLFFDMWVQHNGMPKVIVNDQDVKFKSELWTLLMKKVRMKQKFCTTFHLQTNRQTEKMNGVSIFNIFVIISPTIIRIRATIYVWWNFVITPQNIQPQNWTLLN